VRGSGREPVASRTLATDEITSHRVQVMLSVAAVVLLTVLLYRRALTFAFFNDDPTGHFAWMEGRSILDFFAGSAEYGYYRPVVFAVLRGLETLFGNVAYPHNPVAGHALLVLLHGANVALVWLLAYRLSGRAMAYAWIAALVFAFTPFSYEAVAYVASLTHPLHVFWLLLALLLFDHGRQTRERRFLVFSGLAQVIALFSHENGLFIFPALVGLDWVVRPGAHWRERARWLWLYGIITLSFAALWLVVPKNSEQGLNAIAGIGRNTIPFLQTLVYPLLPAVRPDAAAVWVPVILAGLVAGATGWLARRLGAWRLWVFAVGWLTLAALPSLLFLGPAYVYGSPRLSYLPSIGVALLWAIPGLLVKRGESADFADDADSESGKPKLLSVSRGKVPGVAGAVLAVGYLAVLIAPALPFIQCQLGFYDETSRIARRMATVAGESPDGREIVFVNLPFFFSSTAERPDGCPNPYPWTPTGGVLIPPYARVRDFVRFNGGPDHPVDGVTVTAFAPGWRTFGPEIAPEELRATVENEIVYVFDLPGGEFGNLSAAWQPGQVTTAAAASFGEILDLTGGRLISGDDRLTVALDWQVAGEPAAPLSAFVHVYSSSGLLVAQADGPPGGGVVPQALWQAGDQLKELRIINTASLTAGTYTAAVGLYSALDGVRLPATAAGEALAENIYIIGQFER
jgi:hypothetical protein